MPDDRDDSEAGIILINWNAPKGNSLSHSVKHKDQDFETQNVEELDHVDTDFDNIPQTKLVGANNSEVQAQKGNQTDTVDVDWWVTVLVSMVAVWAGELLSVLSCCQSCCLSCYQTRCQSSAADRPTLRVAVRAQPQSELLSVLLSELGRCQSCC